VNSLEKLYKLYYTTNNPTITSLKDISQDNLLPLVCILCLFQAFRHTHWRNSYIHSENSRSASDCHQIQLRIIRNCASFTRKPVLHALQDTSNCKWASVNLMSFIIFTYQLHQCMKHIFSMLPLLRHCSLYHCCFHPQ